MPIYHQIVINNENFYREYNESLEQYEEMLSEEELVASLLDEVVEETIEIDEYEIQSAVNRILNVRDRNVIQDYIRYLERLSQE